MIEELSRSCLSNWYPKIKASRITTPATEMVTTDAKLSLLLDGRKPKGYREFLGKLEAAVDKIGGAPCFLRTGHTAGADEWKRTCYVGDVAALASHVSQLVSYSDRMSMFGLPTRIWAVRRLCNAKPVFHCGERPIFREFRVFVEDGETKCCHPRLPATVIESARPDIADWRSRLPLLYTNKLESQRRMERLAERAGKAVGGGRWAVDFLETARGGWTLIDMADGDVAYHWADCRAGLDD